MNARYIASVIVAATLIGSLCSTVAGSEGQKLPGTYRGWNDVDEVTIVNTFRLVDYRQIVVMPLDPRGVRLPPADENTSALAKEALATVTQDFVQGIKEKLSGIKVQVIDSPPHDGLLIRARIEKVDPGSKAARIWGGFGAGAAQVSISGEILDAATNRILLRFAQERRSAVKTIFQHDRVLISRSVRQIGRDVAGLLKGF